MKDKFRNRTLWASLLILGPIVAAADAPPAHPPGPPGSPRFRAMDVALTEEQQDKVFAITHAAAPALREHEKAARRAREALHQLARAPSFSDSSAATLAQAQGAADSQLALLRTKMEHDVYAVLTPEQQAKVASREKECDVQDDGGMQPGGWTPR